ncbi:MAG: Fur family transcriptional regulator [Thermoplasmata archaeon]
MFKKREVNTNQRQIIYNFMMTNKGHFTASQVYDNVKSTLPRITKATVYKVLRHLVDKGLIMSFVINEVEIFDSNAVHDVHEHFVCTVCHNIYDIYVPEVRKAFTDEIAKKYPEKEFNYFSIVITGICESCQKKGEKNG